MRWYIDSSVALHAVLPGSDQRARAWLDGIHARNDDLFSSVLLELELVRALRRERLHPGRAQLALKRTDLIDIDDKVLRFAAAIEPHVKSLDAIHLATCALLGTGVVLATHDANMIGLASTLGFDAFDPFRA